jgi:hypothetical protein
MGFLHSVTNDARRRRIDAASGRDMRGIGFAASGSWWPGWEQIPQPLLGDVGQRGGVDA